MSDRLTLIRAAERIRRALRQERRMQAAHAAELSETKRIGHIRGFVPDSVHALVQEFQDELYFFIIAVRQAVSSRTVLERLGYTLPVIRRQKGLVAWRDIYEHWGDAAVGKPVWAQNNWVKDTGGGDPGGTMTYNADEGITQVSGISLVDLRRDLEAVLATVEQYEEQAFDEDWPTREQAATFMQMDPKKFDQLSRWGGVGRLDWSHRDAGLRYRRSDLDRWKAKLIAQDDWPPAP